LPLLECSPSLYQFEPWKKAQHLWEIRDPLVSHRFQALPHQALTIYNTDHTPKSEDDDERCSFKCFLFHTGKDNQGSCHLGNSLMGTARCTK
jgi:hypothetical protein